MAESTLESPGRGLQIYNHAERFRSAVGVLSNNPGGGELTKVIVKNSPDVPYPLLVLAHLATELYLKSVLVSVTGKLYEGHNTWKLFTSLKPKVHQDSIVEYYKDLIASVTQLHQDGSPPDANEHLRNTLKSVGEAYNVLRYVFEYPEALPSNTILNSGFVMEAVRRYAVEMVLQTGQLYMLMVEAVEKDGEWVDKEGGAKRVINKDSSDLRGHVKYFFDKRLSGDPLDIYSLDPVILNNPEES